MSDSLSKGRRLAQLQRLNRVLTVSILMFAICAVILSFRVSALEHDLRQARLEMLRSPFPHGSLLPPLRGRRVDGSILDTSELLGSPVLLVFAAPGCPSCHHQIEPWLTMAKALKPRGLATVAILREGGEDKDKEDLVARLAPGFDVCIGVENPAALATLRGASVPRSYLLDRYGRLIATGSPGMPLDGDTVRKALYRRYPEMANDSLLLAKVREIFPTAASVTREAWPRAPSPTLGRWRLRVFDAAQRPLGSAAVIEQDLRCPVCRDVLVMAGVDSGNKVAGLAQLRAWEVRGNPVDHTLFFTRLRGSDEARLSRDEPEGISGATKSSRALRLGLTELLRVLAEDD